MATLSEIAALDQIEAALANLRTLYAVSGGAENRRDQIAAFVDTSMQAVAELASKAGADPLVAIYSLDSVLQDLADAFVDAIEAEDEAEPRIDPVSQWGTYNARAL